MPVQIHTLLLVTFFLGIGIAHEASSQELSTRVSSAIDNWTSDSHTVIDFTARKELQREANDAVVQTLNVYQDLTRSEVEKVVPGALISFLTNSQGNKPYAPLTQLVQERIIGSGQVLPVLTRFPTLSIVISPPAPPDFAVSINGIAYPAGSTSFRLIAGPTRIHIVRAGRSPCDRRIFVTEAGPNIISCHL